MYWSVAKFNIHSFTPQKCTHHVIKWCLLPKHKRRCKTPIKSTLYFQTAFKQLPGSGGVVVTFKSRTQKVAGSNPTLEHRSWEEFAMDSLGSMQSLLVESAKWPGNHGLGLHLVFWYLPRLLHLLKDPLPDSRSFIRHPPHFQNLLLPTLDHQI